MLAASVDDHRIRIWDVESQELIRTLNGHTNYIHCLIWLPDGQTLISASNDRTIRIWNVETGLETASLEGPTEYVTSLSLSADGKLLAVKAGVVWLWRCDTWDMVARLSEAEGNEDDSWWAGIAFHPELPILATLDNDYTSIRIWELDINAILGKETSKNTVRYTTAKIVLVGDSGVGKTGLGWRLAHGQFKEQSSTHGQQFWIINELNKQLADSTECETVLWDLAGQPDYRLVHAPFLDDIDTALVLFDPTNRQDPLSGVDSWLNQLKSKQKNLCNSILVGARIDRGASTLTDDELRAYCNHNGVNGGYIPTSALSGEGIPELLECLKTLIPWGEMPTTVTTLTFKRIKEYVLMLKEQTAQESILVNPDELRVQLQTTDPDWAFSDDEIITAVGHLANHGYVTALRSSRGTLSFLLMPDLLANLASSIVLEARRNPRGLGVVDEKRLLIGDYRFPELHGLDKQEREILLDAATVLFLEHNLCFREFFNHQTFLVFPSLINEKRPPDESLKTVEGASYHVKGAVENVYASLVVLLGYTNIFIRSQQWRNQAQYEMGEGEICGFQQINNNDGEVELLLYYGELTPEPVRLMFRGMFERFLSRRELEISRYQPIICSNIDCDAQLARNVVFDQLRRGRNFSFCNECGEKLILPIPESLTRLSRRVAADLDIQHGVAQRRTAFETALVRVKALLRNRDEAKKPTCFVSYAWGVPEHELWVIRLAKDLRNADIDMLLDRWDSPLGSNLDLFIERIMSSDFVIPVGTPRLVATNLFILDERGCTGSHLAVS